MYYCISAYYILLYILHLFSSTGITSSSEGNTSTFTDVKNLFGHGWIEFYISNPHIPHSIRFNDYNIHQKNTKIPPFIYDSYGRKSGINSNGFDISDEHYDPFDKTHQTDESDYIDTTTHTYDQFTTRDFDGPGSAGSYHGHMNIPDMNNLPIELDRTLIHKYISSRNTDMNYELETHSSSYKSYMFLYMMVFTLSKDQNSCDLVDINIFPLEQRALVFIKIMNLSDTSLSDVIHFLQQFNDQFAVCEPVVFSGKIYSFSPDCTKLQLLEPAVEQYFVTTNDKITVKGVIGRIKSFCPLILNFITSEQSYSNLVYPLELRERFEDLGKRLADSNDPIHKSKTRISDFCSGIIKIPNIGNFIKDHAQAIDSISCHIRRLFNVVNNKDKDYENGYNILNSHYMTTSSTTPIIISTNGHKPSVLSSSTSKLPDKLSTPITTEKHINNSTTVTEFNNNSITITIISTTSSSSLSKENQNASSGKSKKLSSLQIGLICTGVIACVLVLIAVTIFIHKKRSYRDDI